MNYSIIYDGLINKRKDTTATGYIEHHHIIPKCMGGKDDESNLVSLTGREHWIAHLLLYRIYKLPKLAHACNMMAMRCEERDIIYIKNSRLYEHIRKEHAKHISNIQRGRGNSQYGTRWVCNVELKQNKKISKDGAIPMGWVKGRNRWKVIDSLTEKRNTQSIRIARKAALVSDQQRVKEFESERKRLYAVKLFNEFKLSGCRSMRQFVQISAYPYSQHSLSKMWKKYIPEFNPRPGTIISKTI